MPLWTLRDPFIRICAKAPGVTIVSKLGDSRMFGRSNWKRKNRQQIKDYERMAQQIGDNYDAKMRPNKDGTQPTPEVSVYASDEYNEHMRPVLNQLALFRQKELLYRLNQSPIEVPAEYWMDTKDPYRKLLYPKGVVWVEHELRKIRNAEIEFWFKLVVPLLALCISIVALVRSGHTH
jgi:hypothetical protein